MSREGERQLRVSPEELYRVVKGARKLAEQQVVAAHRNIITKAVMAGTTPNIDMRHVPLVNMADTVPVLSSKRTRNEAAHFWIPKKCASLRVFWSGSAWGDGGPHGSPGHLAPSHCLYDGMAGW